MKIHIRTLFTFIGVTFLTFNLSAQMVRIKVEPGVTHTMKGGIGASWHAIGTTGFYYQKEKVFVREGRRARGSGWGANPPTSYTTQWEQLREHWRWLGMSFSRVELDMRMYSPEKGVYDWDNEEMQTLYRILDICQELQVDVFLTQMWQDVQWNAIDGVSLLQSAPKSEQDFADAICTLMEHLVKKKSYTCIKYFCMVNEPLDGWGWWLGADGKSKDLMPAMRLIRAGLDKRGIQVPLSGPDFIRGDDLQTPNFNWNDPVVGAYDMHDYTEQTPITTDWMSIALASARKRNVPFFISEFGSHKGGNADKNPFEPACSNYENQLINAEKIITGLNVGVDGFNRWSFTNRGDLDGEWQLVNTWDPLYWKFYDSVSVKIIPYYAYGIFTRFIPKYSNVLKSGSDDKDVLVTAVRSPNGELSIVVLNKSTEEKSVTIDLPKNYKTNKYQVVEALLDKDYKMEPVKTFSGKSLSDKLPARSITTYSSYDLKHTSSGVLVEK